MVIGSNILAGSSGQGGGYNISRSLRFRASASAYLSRTPASTTNQKTFTISMWVKRGNSGSNISLVSCRSGSSPLFQYQFYSDNTLSIEGSSAQLRTTQVFRDFSAWYHIVLAIDTTQATSSDRIKMYVNGVQVTSFVTATYPSQNTNFNYNVNSATSIGSLQPFDTQYFDGYMAEIHSIDGQALTPSSFGETSTNTGVWIPKRYTGTYGTNGFYLPFSDNTSTTTLGYDKSGNSNNWTANNISLTTGSTYDSMTDVPTLTDASTSNFATWNPLSSATQGGSYTMSNGNLLATEASGSTSGYVLNTMTMSSGKWYWEVTCTSAGSSTQIGIKANTPTALANKNGLGGTSDSYAYRANGNKVTNNTDSAYGASYTTNDVIGVAFDATAGTLTFYKNNTSQGTAFTGITGEYFAGIGDDSFSSNHSLAVNFGQRPFAYTPPTGYVALNTYNLPTPTIGATASSQANKYFDAKLYTGTGSAQSITGLNFQPDFVWIKSRSNAGDHGLVDAVRGRSKVVYSDLTDAEGTSSATEDVTAFNSDGFSLGTSARFTSNNNGWTFASWNWKANGSGSSNTAGSITSTVSANTTSGFSVVTYTGNGTGGATVGHGLGVAPKMLIVKNRVQGTYGNWNVWHTAITGSQYLSLNLTDAVSTNNNRWNGTIPTSTVFSLGADSFGNTNKSGDTYVAYVFSEVAGFSKFGSYTGNGSSDGTFVALPFKPKFIMVKCTNDISHWTIVDRATNPYNVAVNSLYTDSSAAENATIMDVDFLSNGFKFRGVLANECNVSGYTYVYAAFAEVPQKFALGV